MKNCLAASRILLCAAFFLISGAALNAQAPGDPNAPPAYGVAQRLQAEALAARASGQSQTAHNRAYQAVLKLQQVVSSRAFGHTPYAREALRQQAKLEENFLQDKNAAIQSLQTLHNTFPDDKPVLPEIKRVGDALDQFNQTITPQSTPFHVLGATLYRVMDFLVALTGRQSWSYFVAILLVSVLVKLALTPLSNKQYASMKAMQKLQPYMTELQAKHKNDKELLGRKMMELYKDHGINPAAGCITMLPTIPIMYLLYYMIRLYQFQFSHGTFLWISSNPLSHLFPSILALNLGQPDWPLLLLYAGSMYVTQKMTITPSMDPQQAETQRMMTIMTPFMTTYFFYQYHLPSAFVLYYLIFNILSTAQQKYYMRKRAGDAPAAGSEGDGGSKGLPVLPNGSGGGQSKTFTTNGNGNGTSSHRVSSGRTVPIAEASEARTNGTVPTARGVIAPKKVHPKKKRR
jgi:YidC/Oxa1 family membrane protein insertase